MKKYNSTQHPKLSEYPFHSDLTDEECEDFIRMRDKMFGMLLPKLTEFFNCLALIDSSNILTKAQLSEITVGLIFSMENCKDGFLQFSTCEGAIAIINLFTPDHAEGMRCLLQLDEVEREFQESEYVEGLKEVKPEFRALNSK